MQSWEGKFYGLVAVGMQGVKEEMVASLSLPLFFNSSSPALPPEE